MDNTRVDKHIIVSDFNVINGTFIAVSYHSDLVIYRMMYNWEERTITSMTGPYGKITEVFTVDDKRLVEYYGTNISKELFYYIEKRVEQCTGS